MPAQYLRARSLQEASAWLGQYPDARLLAGGQSLLPALRLGLSSASHLIDLQDLAPLQKLEARDGGLFIGALCTHAQVARSALVRGVQPWLAALAGHIADPQVREMGTIGGSLANADPAACWPAAVLAADAVIETTERTLPADAFFRGLFSTALRRGELIVGVRFPSLAQAAYRKFEQPASRFAHPGVAVARHRDGRVRVAVTGLGQGVVRWTQAEAALAQDFSQVALQGVALNPALGEEDLHASASYKAHLAHVLCRRVLADLCAQPYLRLGATPVQDAAGGAVDTLGESDPAGGLSGERVIRSTPRALWDLVLDPQVLQACMPGCESIQRLHGERYEAVVQVGIGLVSARFKSTVDLTPINMPTDIQGGRMRLTVVGNAGPMGQARAEAHFSLEPLPEGATRLRWQAVPVLEGKLAQIGQRFVFAVARQLSDEFLDRLQTRATGQAPQWRSAPWPLRWLQKLLSMLNFRR